MRVVILGEIYNADLSIGGGPIIPPSQPPLGIWGPTDPRPTHPIVIPPDAIAPGVPTHPIYIPVYPGHPIVIPPDAIAPGTPTHPIYLPVYPEHPIVIPPDAVGPGQPEHPIVLPIYPDQGLPGPQPHPEHPWVPPSPGTPTHPWVPPSGGAPGVPTHPIYNPVYPSHPIVIPPEAIIPAPDGKATVVVYYGGQRIVFTVEAPEEVPPTEAAPKA